MNIAPTQRISYSQQFETPTTYFSRDDDILRDWLETDTIVNSIADLSPVTTLSDLADVIPEEDEYRAMPRSLRRVLTPPQEYAESPSRPRSVLFESALPQSPTSVSAPSSPYSKPRYSPSSDHSPTGGVPRARQSVSSIGSCSTIQTRTVPVKSILTRHDSGISMATTTNAKTTSRGGRKKKRSPPSVKFVEAPTVHYDHGVYINTPPCSPPATLGVSGRRKRVKPSRWFTRWWKRSPSPPPRPVISGPYHLSYTASLVDVYASRSEKAGGGRLKRLWVRITSAIS